MSEHVKPPRPYPRVSPMLTVEGAAQAIEFYKRAFAAVERDMRLTTPDGKILHAELDFDGSIITIADAMPGWGIMAPDEAIPPSVRMALAVDDAQTWFDRAVEAGAEVLIALGEQYYGHRSGRLRDPFGHVWVISQDVEGLDRTEMQRRTTAMFEGAGDV
ncbi:MAG: VOC family protein [Pseudomonadota bacterium]